MSGRALIVANGVLPDWPILKSELAQADFVLAADGGADKLLAAGAVPNAVIGDFDSMTVMLPDHVKRISAPDQDATDLEKAVIYLRLQGYQNISVVGGSGNRLDHTFGSLALICKYSLRLVDDFGITTSIIGPGSISLQTSPGQTISLMPCGLVSGLTTTGLKWELQDENFNFAERDGTSNVALGTKISVETNSGYLIIYAHHVV